MQYFIDSIALNSEMIKEVLDIMLGLAKEGITMMVVTHVMGFAHAAANKKMFMDEGMIIKEGLPTEGFDYPKENRTK